MATTTTDQPPDAPAPLDAPEVLLAGTEPNAASTVLESTGNMWVAPIGTAIPADFTGPATPWVNIGHISTDGPRPTGWNRDPNPFYSWNSPSKPVRSYPSPAQPQFQADLLEANAQTFTLYFGGGTTVKGTPPAPDVYTPPAGDPVEQALLVDWWDGTRQYRWTFARTMPIAGGDITLASGDLALFPVRFDVLTPADGSSIFKLLSPGTGP